MIDSPTPFDEFRLVVAKHVKELTNAGLIDQSTDWYCLKYLRRVQRRINQSSSPRDVENTIRALIRFYLDSIDEKSPLGDRCQEVLYYHRRALRLEKRD